MSSHHGHDHHTSFPQTRLLFVIIFNMVITMAEYVGGLLSGSLALMSDAGHNLSDVLSLILGYAGERVSETKPGARYSFGLKRFEVLIALINALTLLGIGLYIVYEAVMRYLHPVPVRPEILIPVAVIGLLGNILSMLLLRGGRDKNLNMRAAFLHLLYDAVSSVAVIAAGVILFFTELVIFDLIISLFIVLMIGVSSVGIIAEAMRIFLQGTPSGIDPEEVEKGIRSVEGVGGVHGLHIWSISTSEVFLSCHICTAETPAPVSSDDIIRRVNEMLEQRFAITHTALQVENTNLCSFDSGKCCR